VSESIDPADGEIRWQGSRQAERPALSIAKLNAVHAGGERAGNRITWNHFFFGPPIFFFASWRHR
jgi:hypothetical protein